MDERPRQPDAGGLLPRPDLPARLFRGLPTGLLPRRACGQHQGLVLL
jgi:hypothetical protein